MEVTVATSHGKQCFSLNPSWTVLQLKQELHSRLPPALHIPIPEKQRLVCATNNSFGKLRDDEIIGSIFKAGDNLVVLSRRPAALTFALDQTMPAVTLAECNAAIKQENERMIRAGEPVPPAVQAPPQPASERRRGAVTNRLEGSIRALVEGNFEQLRGYLEQLQDAVVHGVGVDESMMFDIPVGMHIVAGDEEQEQEEMHSEEEEELDEEHPHRRHGIDRSGLISPAVVEIPEVNAEHLAELQSMGFSEQLSRNALLLNRNMMERAVEWALNHGDDHYANNPISQQDLEQVYRQRAWGGMAAALGLIGDLRRRPHLPPGQVDPETLNTMVDMGFPREDSQRALVLTRNRLEEACQVLLSGTPLPPLPAQQGEEQQEHEGGGGGNGSTGTAAAAAAAAEQATPTEGRPGTEAPAPTETTGAAADAVIDNANSPGALDQHIEDEEDDDDDDDDDGDDDVDMIEYDNLDMDEVDIMNRITQMAHAYGFNAVEHGGMMGIDIDDHIDEDWSEDDDEDSEEYETDDEEEPMDGLEESASPSNVDGPESQPPPQSTETGGDRENENAPMPPAAE